MTRPCRRFAGTHTFLGLLAFSLLLCCYPRARAQPTYKLEVKPDLKPEAKLRLDGARLTRSAVKDDPGFRLQYDFKKDGKTVATAEARAAETLDIPQKDAGTYTVVLELFYPAYKGGTQQKGEFKPISNVLTFRVEPGAKAGDPVKLVPVDAAPSGPSK
jgi:hypothetical protein